MASCKIEKDASRENLPMIQSNLPDETQNTLSSIHGWLLDANILEDVVH